jgi:hypothetical protein
VQIVLWDRCPRRAANLGGQQPTIRTNAKDSFANVRNNTSSVIHCGALLVIVGAVREADGIIQSVLSVVNQTNNNQSIRFSANPSINRLTSDY